MSALRKAGVWLGLIEDETDAYEERELPRTSRERLHVRQRDVSRSYDDYPDEDDEPPAGHRSGDGDRPTERVPPRRADRGEDARPGGRGDELRGRGDEPRGRGDDPRGNVRSITREGRDSGGRDSGVAHLTRDNLALAPQPPHPAPPERTPTAEERRYQITTLHPTTYREARTIGEHFREGTPVIMNLTEMDEADARRLVDFGAGLAFGLRGTMERVTNRVFLLSPANVQVTAEDKAKIAEGEFFQHR